MIENILKSTVMVLVLLLFHGCSKHPKHREGLETNEHFRLESSEKFVTKRRSEDKNHLTDEKRGLEKDTIVFDRYNSKRKEIVVGVVMDGDMPLTDGVVKRIKREIELLENDEFIVRFPKNKRLSGQWQKKGIDHALNRLYGDKEVDIVMAIGISSSAVTVMRKAYPKPTIATFVINNKLRNIPFNGKSSGKHNLTYIGIDTDIEKELKKFRKLVDFQHVTLLSDALFGEVMPQLAKRGKKLSEKMGIRLTVMPHSGGEIELSALPEGTDAILLGALPRLSRERKKELLHSLATRGLPVYGLVSKESVEQGALLSTVPAENWEQRSRRIALDIQGILYGEDPKDMEVLLKGHERMTLNMQTAKQLDISPPFEVLLKADKVHVDQAEVTTYWSLSQVAKRAVHGKSCSSCFVAQPRYWENLS